MTELKTLKDIASWGSIPRSDDWKQKGFYVPMGRKDEEWCTKSDLKAEAIKIVKHNPYITTADWLRFFNLTDEDLK